MTDLLALLREEIHAEMSMRCSVIQKEQAMVEVLRGVLARMDRIERDHPAEASVEPTTTTGRATRRNLRSEIIALLPAGTGRGLSLISLAEGLSNTVSATKRALDAMIRKGVITEVGGLYFLSDERVPLAEAAQ